MLVGAIAIVGCAKPPKVSTEISATRTAPDTVTITLKVTNDEDHATTPIAVDLTVQTNNGNDWDKPISVIHPTAFVLNRREAREMSATLKTQSALIRTRLILKEQETGKILKQQTVERILSLTSPR